MAVRIYSAPAGTEPTDAEVGLLSAAAAACGRATLLVPTLDARDTCRRRLADAGAGTGIEVATPAAWVAGLWGLFGDGRRIVSAAERKLLMAQVAADADESARANAPGSVSLLAELARDCLPFALDRPRPAAAGFSAAERRLLKMLAVYEERLRGCGLIEASSAACALAEGFGSVLPACARAVAVRGVSRLPEWLLSLLDAVAGAGDVVFVLNGAQSDMVPSLEERFCCAAEELPGAEPPAPVPAFAEVGGPTARDAAQTRIIEALAADDVAVAAPDPLAAFRVLAPRLAARGIAARAEGSAPFSETRAGQMLMRLVDLLDRMETEEPGAWWPAPEIPDWIRSPFSGIGPASAHTAVAFDTSLRKTRRLTGEGLLARLDSLQSSVQNLERERADEQGRERRPIVVKSVLDALAQCRYARALQLMRDAAAAAPASAFGAAGAVAQQAELGSLQAALELFDRARQLGVSDSAACGVLGDLRVRASLAAYPDVQAGARAAAGPSVSFRSLECIADAAPASCEAVFIADASAAANPLIERESIGSIVAAKLGCAGIELAPVARQRDLFSRALQAARGAAALAYVARDDQAAECYPAVAYTELKAANEGLAPSVALPPLPAEAELFANLDPAGGAGMHVDDGPRLGEHALTRDAIPFLMPGKRRVGDRAVPRALSASQIENYLSCPYSWFIGNRVSTRRLDAEFGAIEQGNFAHDVMQRFHERLREAGLGRVRPDGAEGLSPYLQQMDAAFDEVREDHARGKYTHGKYAEEKRPRPVRGALVAIDELERNRLEAMRPAFHEVVRYESTLLPIYEPALFEYSFDKEGVTYAGHPLGGRIDRIDVAPSAGDGERFVIIDYKNRADVSSFNSPDPSMMLEPGEELAPGWLPGREQDRAPKVQALVYALAYQRLIAGSAQGAVYIGLRGPQAAGAVSDALTECEPPAFPQDKVAMFPGVKKPRSRAKHDGDMRFPDLLECVEHAIAGELARLEAGAIAPRPASDSCAYCPLTMCEKRR